jgi:hypothetical protein
MWLFYHSTIGQTEILNLNNNTVPTTAHRMGTCCPLAVGMRGHERALVGTAFYKFEI